MYVELENSLKTGQSIDHSDTKLHDPSSSLCMLFQLKAKALKHTHRHTFLSFFFEVELGEVLIVSVIPSVHSDQSAGKRDAKGRRRDFSTSYKNSNFRNITAV